MELYGVGNLIEASNGCRRNLNLTGLDALDLRTHKADGTPWDFNSAADKRLAKKMVLEKEPTWLIGSPPCTPFSRLNTNMNFPKMPKHVVEAKLAEGRRRLRFVISLYQLQLQAGRHFLHEHPAGASSWADP